MEDPAGRLERYAEGDSRREGDGPADVGDDGAALNEVLRSGRGVAVL